MFQVGQSFLKDLDFSIRDIVILLELTLLQIQSMEIMIFILSG
jgi:hypothetical protein